MPTISFRVSVDQHDELSRLATEKKTTISDLFRAAAEEMTSQTWTKHKPGRKPHKAPRKKEYRYLSEEEVRETLASFAIRHRA